MDAKQAFKELERFAAARARGATVICDSPNGGNRTMHSDDNLSMITARDFSQGWTIKEIIEPTVTRDWTAEDALNHLGWGIRHVGDRENVFVIRDPFHTGGGNNFCRSEYAAPVPGTDPTKWDWKPCKVEVQAETPKTDPKTVAAIRLANLWVRIRGFRSLGFHPPAAVNSHLAEIIEIKNLLEQS